MVAESVVAAEGLQRAERARETLEFLPEFLLVVFGLGGDALHDGRAALDGLFGAGLKRTPDPQGVRSQRREFRPLGLLR